MPKDSFRVRAAEFFDVPSDIEGGLLHIELKENRAIYIENHKGILELMENEVLLDGGNHLVRVRGSRLCINAINTCEIRLSGQIESVSFELQR